MTQNEPVEHIDIANALRCRFESDAFFGAGALPVYVPRQTAVGRRPDSAPVTRPAAAAGQPVAPVPAPTPAPPRPAISAEEVEQRRTELEQMDVDEVKVCTKCGLSATRTKTVFGVGAPAARIVFVGEAPGHDEDVSGVAFVGRAGKLLTDMIQKGMGLRREDTYICNVLKCRPPNNRTPAADEIAACRGYLDRQLEIIRPEMIIALGAPAAQTLLNTRAGIGQLRGRFHDFYTSGTSLIGDPIPLMPTFHPAYLLRDPSQKIKAWADLKMVMARLGIPIPQRR